jgi:class 3 adenylate cyclase
MLLPSLTKSISKLFQKVLPSIVIVLPFVLLAPVGYRLFEDRQKDIKKLATELRFEITDQIEGNIQLYLKTTHLVNQTNTTVIESGQFNFIESGQFNFDDFQRLGRLFSKQIQNFKEINNMYISNPEGYFFGVEWQQRQENKWTFIMNEQAGKKFNSSKSLKVLGNFDPHKRPWYKAAENQCKPTWSEAYIDFSTKKPAITAVHPVCDKGKLLAVFGSDFLLSEVDLFLKDLKEDHLEAGEIFITDRAGQLLTTSTGSKGNQTKLIKATESEDKLIRETAKYLEGKFNKFSNINREQLDFKLNGDRQFLQVTPLTDDYDLDWLIVVVIPENEILEEININIRNAIGLYFAALILAMAVVILLVRWSLLRAENTYLQCLAQLKDDFFAAASRFVPHDFLHFLGRSIIDVELGDQVQKEMTIMFADIRSFTNLSEKMTPQENFNFINSFFGKISPVVRNHGGIIDKYIGDSIMALFPQPSAEMALQAAITMQHEVSDYNKHRLNSGERPIAIGIGLHTGKLILGTIGEPKRMETTVISDAVNLASRLEGLTKLYGAGILISGETLFKLDPSNYNYRCLGQVRVKGRNEPVSVFEVYDTEPAAIIKLKNQSKTDFELALLLYSHKEFTQANHIFQEILRINPQDRAAKMYVERSEFYQKHGVHEDWEGIEDFNSVKK